MGGLLLGFSFLWLLMSGLLWVGFYGWAFKGGLLRVGFKGGLLRVGF